MMRVVKWVVRPAVKTAARFAKPVAAAIGAAVAYRCACCRRRRHSAAPEDDEEVVIGPVAPTPPVGAYYIQHRSSADNRAVVDVNVESCSMTLVKAHTP